MALFRLTTTCAVALSLAVSATSALADLTPDQVWQDWKSYLGGFGYEVTGEPVQSGSTLTVRDLGMTIQMLEDAGSVSMRVGQVQMIGNADGTVSVILPERMPVAIEALDDEGEQVTTTMEIAHQGLSMTVSGSPEAMQYTYDATELSMALVDLMAGGESLDIKAAQIRFADVTGTSLSTVNGRMRALSQAMTAGPVTYDLDFTDPNEGGRLAFTGSVAQARFKGEGEIPQSFDGENIAASLNAGFRFDSRFEYEQGSSAYRFEDLGDAVEGTNSSDSGSIATAIGPDGLRYAAAGRNMAITVNTPNLPFPVTVNMARLGFSFATPVAKSETAQDFALTLDLSDFTMSDMIWALFDPGQQLPRDPATIGLDLSGKGRLFLDLLDPGTAGKLESENAVPGELESLDLNNLTLSIAGATLTGEGGFVFDQDDITTFDGMPAPEGAVDLTLVGGNILLDKLIAMGLLPRDQATGVRMMMGLFAVPAEGEDTLTSRIEVTEDGQVLANGQRLR